MSVEEKLDKILDKQSDMAVTLARVEVDVAHHIKRSDMHEAQLKEQAEKLGTQNDKISKLWYAVVGLAGAGIGNAGPNILKYLGGLL